jgi:integrase
MPKAKVPSKGDILIFQKLNGTLPGTRSEPLTDADFAWSFYSFVLDAGMRPEEVFRIRPENIDLKQKTIFNPFGKTKASRRSIPMTEDVLSILRARTKKAKAIGTPNHFRLYDLRHTFATRALRPARTYQHSARCWDTRASR